MLAPAQPHGWMELAATTGERYPAEMAVRTALRSVPPRGALEAEDLCQAYAQTGEIRDSLRAIMVAPWRRNGWGGLGDALTESA
jgi:superkiller protein 3